MIILFVVDNVLEIIEKFKKSLIRLVAEKMREKEKKGNRSF